MNKNHGLYEKFTKLYEVIFKPFFIGGIKKSMKVVEKNKHNSLLEVGCGPGYSFEFYPAGVSVSAYDLSEKMVEEAKKRAAEILDNDIKVLDDDSYHSLTDGKTYDAVLSFSVITVVPDAQTFLEELRMRCKKGGYIYLVMHQRSKGPFVIFDYLFELPSRFLFGFTLFRHIDDLDTRGLEIIENKKINSFSFIKWSNLIVLKKNF